METSKPRIPLANSFTEEEVKAVLYLVRKLSSDQAWGHYMASKPMVGVRRKFQHMEDKVKARDAQYEAAKDDGTRKG